MAKSTYSTDDMLVLFNAATVAELRQESKWMQLTSQRETSRWAAGQCHIEKVNIPNWDYAADGDSSVGGNQPAGVRAVDRARGGSWTDPNSGRFAQLDFERQDGTQIANELDVEDVAESTWPVIEQTRSRQMYVMKRALDSKLYTAWTGGIGTGATEQTTYGAAGTNFVSRTAPYPQTGDADGAIYDSIVAYSLKCKRANVDSMESDSVGRKFMVMSPELFEVLVRYLKDEKLMWDALTEDLLVQGSVRGGGAFEGRLRGIDIFTDNQIAVPTGAANWQWFAGVRETWRANTRMLDGYTQIFTPAQNQISDHPAHLLRSTMDIGWLEITSGDLAGLNHRFVLHAD